MVVGTNHLLGVELPHTSIIGYEICTLTFWGISLCQQQTDVTINYKHAHVHVCAPATIQINQRGNFAI